MVLIGLPVYWIWGRSAVRRDTQKAVAR
jgi:hypothetical protein